MTRTAAIVKKIVIYFIAATSCIIFMIPIFWVLSSSLKIVGEVYAKPTVWWPSPMHFENYLKIVYGSLQPPYSFFLSIPRYFLNSVIIASLVALISIIVGIFAGYSIQRFQTGGLTFAGLLLIQRFLPPVLLVIPLSQIFKTLRLLDTWWALILSHLIYSAPFATWMTATYFKAIPRELDEAALVDGYNRWQALIHIILPTTMPAVAAITAIVFVASWNEFLFAVTLTSTPLARTVPVYIAMLQGPTNIPVLSAAAIIGMLPAITIFILIQKYLVSGLSMGVVKG